MDGTVASGNIILLLDEYSLTSRLLHESLQQIGEVLAIVITEDNFLPDKVLSIYDFMIGNYRSNTIRKNGKPKYFNEIPIPDTWSFHAGNEKSGNIVYQQVKKGEIRYVNASRKLVQEVEWYDRAGVTRFCDHYNRYGDICARTVYDSAGEAVSKTWFSPEGREVIVENYVTHDILLNDENAIRFFRTTRELMLYCMKKAGFHQGRIFVNSLSTPLFLVNELGASGRDDILFWNKIVGDDIPGNMKFVLDGKVSRCKKVVVQTKIAYERLLEAGVQENRIQKLGFIYSWKKENGHQSEALICTRTDSIEHCEALIKMLPQMHFHIAAPTVMSPQLMNLGEYGNVSLYPEATADVLEKLFQDCDYYLDINHYYEVPAAVYRAFLYNQLIFAFQETVHERNFVADEHIYSVSEFDRMVRDIREVMADRNRMEQCLEKQRKHALAETKETYAEVIGR